MPGPGEGGGWGNPARVRPSRGNLESEHEALTVIPRATIVTAGCAAASLKLVRVCQRIRLRRCTLLLMRNAASWASSSLTSRSSSVRRLEQTRRRCCCSPCSSKPRRGQGTWCAACHSRARHWALLHESSRALTMLTDRILTCRCEMTLVGRGRSSDSGSHSRGRPHSTAQLDSGREGHRR